MVHAWLESYDGLGPLRGKDCDLIPPGDTVSSAIVLGRPNLPLGGHRNNQRAVAWASSSFLGPNGT